MDLDRAYKDGRVKPGAHLLVAAFGAGYTWSGAVLRGGTSVFDYRGESPAFQVWKADGSRPGLARGGRVALRLCRLT